MDGLDNRRSATLSLLVVLGSACWTSPPPTTRGPSDADLTTAAAVLEASLAAQGGRERLARIDTSRSVGTLITKRGVRGKLTIIAARPNSLSTTIEVAGVGTIRQGVSGDVVWEVAFGKPRVLVGAERARQLREASSSAELEWRTTFASATLRGVVDRDGRRAYAIALVTPDDDQLTRYYARDTLMLVGEDYVFASQLQTIPIRTELSDYRTVGGVKLPFHVVRDEGDDVMEIQLSSIELGVVVPAGTFDLPPEIAALAP